MKPEPRSSRPDKPLSATGSHWPQWLWCVLFGLGLLAASANKGFWGAHGESRRAETAREVLEGGNWLAPTLLGEPFLTKPPLLYWASASFMAVFGVHDWAARLPSILATLGSWLAMLVLGRHFTRELALSRGQPIPDGEASALVLLGMPLVLMMGLNAETEPLLLCFSLSAVAAVLALPVRGQPRSAWQWVLPGTFLALGCMTKGPLGWLFPLFGILACETGLPTGRKRVSVGDVLAALGLQVVLALPWFLLVRWFHPGVWDLWMGESVARLNDPAFQTHREPFWYYLPGLAALLPALLWFDTRVLKDRVARIPVVWLVLGVLFLSFAASKRTHYLLSLAPAAALLVITALPEGWPHRLRMRLLGGCARVLPFAGIAAGLWVLASGAVSPGTAVIVTLALGTVLAAWAWRRPLESLPQQWALGLVLLLGIVSLGGPLAAIDAYRSPRGFYESCLPELDSGLPVLNWRNDGYSASFYLAQYVEPVWSVEELDSLTAGGAMLLCRTTELAKLPRRHTLVLSRTLHDPFQPGRTRTWMLARLLPGDTP